MCLSLRLVLLFALLVFTGLSFWGCGPSQDDASAPLIVGMDLSYPPFEMTDEKGEPAGVSAELARALASDLDRELVIENMPFAGLIPALRTGRIDMVISSLTRTEERAESINFSDPYFRVGLALLVSQQSEVASVQDLNSSGVVVAVRTGTTGALWAATNLPDAKVLTFQRESEALQEVIQGRADAFVYDQISVARQQALYPQQTRALLEPLQNEYWAIGLPKGDEALTAEVNAFLERYRANGGFSELANTFLAEEKAAFQAQGVPFAFE